MDAQILIFRRQYFQCFEPEFLFWPPKPLLKDIGIQSWLFANLFDERKNSRLPPQRYQLRVLKLLLAKVEQAIEDPEEDEISDDLYSHLSSLISSNLPSEDTAVQQKTFVTFTCLSDDQSTSDSYRDEPRVTLLERRYLISGSLTTGFRTWEAALHLGSYLLSSTCRHGIEGKNVLELGAGTGFLSTLCAKHLRARHVTSTDGDEGVVEALKENFFLNELEDDSKALASILRWGGGLKGTWVEDDFETSPYDIVLGADITYDKLAVSALVATLRMLFELKPTIDVLISGAVRNLETFETFRHACVRSKFTVNEVGFAPKPMTQQVSLFYATAVPLKILSIKGPQSAAL